MKILHTADVHLRGYGDDRWKVLQRLVALGKEKGVEFFLVSGDLFDKGVEAENLRPKIREVFSNTGFRIVLIPGNHDRDVYRSGLWFGNDVTILGNPEVPFEHEEVRIWGLPFEKTGGREILQELHSLGRRLKSDKKNILLYHGELLDAFFSRGDFGDEGGGRYMPVKLSYFKDMGIDYVLAGHFHSAMNVWKLESGGYFVYPGSPVSITRRETGQRKVNLFELGSPPDVYLLDSPHFEGVLVEFDPFREEDPLERVRERFLHLHPEAKVLLTLKGFLNGKRIGMSEKDLVEEIRRITAGRCETERLEFRDIQVILDDDLAKRFLEKLNRADYTPELKRAVRDVAMRAMMDVGR